MSVPGHRHRLPLRKMALPLTLALATLPVAAEQSQARTGEATVVFRTVDKNGTPVLDLKPGDLDLRVRGQGRQVLSLELVLAPRELFLVAADCSIAAGGEESLRTAVATLIGVLAPTDRLSLILLGNADRSVPLTTDHRRVESALSGAAGLLALRPCETVPVVRTFEQLFVTVPNDARTTLVFLSTGMVGARFHENVGDPYDLTPLSEVPDFRGVRLAAQRYRGNFFVIRLLDPRRAPRRISDGLEFLADATGGVVVQQVRDNDDPIERIVRETAAYYVATFATLPGDLDERAPRVELKIDRDGVTTHVRIGEWPAHQASSRGAR